jgi:hypothetical protein
VIQPLAPELLARILPIGAAGLAAAIAIVNFLPKLDELVSVKVPTALSRPGQIQRRMEQVEVAGTCFQISVVLFAISVAAMLLYIGLSGIYAAWMPPSLIAIGSFVGPLTAAIASALFGFAVLRWTQYYLFLLKQH